MRLNFVHTKLPLVRHFSHELVTYIQSKLCYIYILSGEKKPFFLFYSFHHVHYPHHSGEQFRNSSKRGTFGDALVRNRRVEL